MRIAIVGPDGAGKTSVANQLQQLLPQSKVVYAGKSHNHHLFITKWTYQFWQWTKKLRMPILYQLVRFFLFYPVEYIENLARFQRVKDKKIIIYDRHPIDRMIMIYEYLSKYPDSAKFFNTQYFLLRWCNWWYRVFFPKIEQIYCLLPEPALCWQRSGGHYLNPAEAQWKIDAYRQAVIQLVQRQPVSIIEITPELTINEIAQQILVSLENDHKNN